MITNSTAPVSAALQALGVLIPSEWQPDVWMGGCRLSLTGLSHHDWVALLALLVKAIQQPPLFYIHRSSYQGRPVGAGLLTWRWKLDDATELVMYLKPNPSSDQNQYTVDLDVWITP